MSDNENNPTVDATDKPEKKVIEKAMDQKVSTKKATVKKKATIKPRTMCNPRKGVKEMAAPAATPAAMP